MEMTCNEYDLHSSDIRSVIQEVYRMNYRLSRVPSLASRPTLHSPGMSYTWDTAMIVPLIGRDSNLEVESPPTFRHSSRPEREEWRSTMFAPGTEEMILAESSHVTAFNDPITCGNGEDKFLFILNIPMPRSWRRSSSQSDKLRWVGAGNGWEMRARRRRTIQ